MITPYVVRGDTAAARFCGFASTDKFKAWATARKLRAVVKRAGKRSVYRVADLSAALDAEAGEGLSISSRESAMKANAPAPGNRRELEAAARSGKRARV